MRLVEVLSAKAVANDAIHVWSGAHCGQFTSRVKSNEIIQIRGGAGKSQPASRPGDRELIDDEASDGKISQTRPIELTGVKLIRNGGI